MFEVTIEILSLEATAPEWIEESYLVEAHSSQEARKMILAEYPEAEILEVIEKGI